jgi:hypothetical protein
MPNLHRLMWWQDPEQIPHTMGRQLGLPRVAYVPNDKRGWSVQPQCEYSPCERRAESKCGPTNPNPVPMQMWRSCGSDEPQSRCRCGSDDPPVPVQMWQGRASVSVQMWQGRAPVPVQMWQRMPRFALETGRTLTLTRTSAQPSRIRSRATVDYPTPYVCTTALTTPSPGADVGRLCSCPVPARQARALIGRSTFSGTNSRHWQWGRYGCACSRRFFAIS